MFELSNSGGSLTPRRPEQEAYQSRLVPFLLCLTLRAGRLSDDRQQCRRFYPVIILISSEDILADGWSSTRRDLRPKANTGHDGEEHPPMLERYLQEEDRIQRLFAWLAEQNNKSKQEKDKQQMNGRVNPGNLASQGGGERGTLPHGYKRKHKAN
ncbi:MAG: hypothetical protein Q9188_007121 [Gyalolechia gomerana]